VKGEEDVLGDGSPLANMINFVRLKITSPEYLSKQELMSPSLEEVAPSQPTVLESGPAQICLTDQLSSSREVELEPT